jgi:hypothetical protein
VYYARRLFKRGSNREVRWSPAALKRARAIYRSLTVKKHYKIVYFVNEEKEEIVVATVWDCYTKYKPPPVEFEAPS